MADGLFKQVHQIIIVFCLPRLLDELEQLSVTQILLKIAEAVA